MPNCYLCGRKISNDTRLIRRKVKTGEYVRKRYTPYRLSAIQSSFGMRIVCKSCASFLDKQAFRSELLSHVWVLAALVLFVLLFLAPGLFH